MEKITLIFLIRPLSPLASAAFIGARFPTGGYGISQRVLAALRGPERCRGLFEIPFVAQRKGKHLGAFWGHAGGLGGSVPFNWPRGNAENIHGPCRIPCLFAYDL